MFLIFLFYSSQGGRQDEQEERFEFEAEKSFALSNAFYIFMNSK